MARPIDRRGAQATPGILVVGLSVAAGPANTVAALGVGTASTVVQATAVQVTAVQATAVRDTAVQVTAVQDTVVAAVQATAAATLATQRVSTPS